MGVTLQNVSYSVNIKERLDFSCALFDPEGDLLGLMHSKTFLRLNAFGLITTSLNLMMTSV